MEFLDLGPTFPSIVPSQMTKSEAENHVLMVSYCVRSREDHDDLHSQTLMMAIL